jgi:hypothetical protein
MKNDTKQMNYVISPLQREVMIEYIDLISHFTRRVINTASMSSREVEQMSKENELMYKDSTLDVRFRIIVRESETYVLKWFKVNDVFFTDEQVKELRKKIITTNTINFDNL